MGKVLMLVLFLAAGCFAQFSNDNMPISKSIAGTTIRGDSLCDSLTSSTGDTVYYPRFSGERVKCKALATWTADTGFINVHLINDPPRTYSRIFIKNKTLVYVLFDKIRKGANTTVTLDSLTLYPR